jgi:uncharacterized protein (TIGR02265 family)
MRPLPSEWNEPPWHLPLDVDACISAIPAHATMTGMFLTAVQDMARSRGLAVEAPRERYIAFNRYPLSEHCQLLVEVAHAVFPGTQLRESLRRIGRGAPQVLVGSLVGRVMLGSVEGPLATLQAMAKSYMLHMQPAVLEVVEHDDRSAIVRMAEIYNFLDSHNVGVFEGVLRHTGVKGRVSIVSHGPTEADLLCEWE